MARLPQSWRRLGLRGRRLPIACGLLLGFVSGCGDIVPLECDARLPVTTQCTTTDSGDSTSTTDASTVTNATSVSTSASTADESAEDPTGNAESGSFCGDGNVDPGEDCDDADLVDIDECSNDCRAPPCGDGIVQPGEDCDLGPDNDDHGPCKLDCSAAICGDGVVRWGVESCDGADTDGVTCETFGYGGGELLCDAWCGFDLTFCTLCAEGDDTCDAYQPCDGACRSGATCYAELGPIGTCLPSCSSPDECPFPEKLFPDCTGDVCVIPCDSECPGGMVCQVTSIYPGPVCLW
jgi:cysteine-rich repeat protein